jgi:hypothetical protein
VQVLKCRVKLSTALCDRRPTEEGLTRDKAGESTVKALLTPFDLPTPAIGFHCFLHFTEGEIFTLQEGTDTHVAAQEDLGVENADRNCSRNPCTAQNSYEHCIIIKTIRRPSYWIFWDGKMWLLQPICSYSPTFQCERRTRKDISFTWSFLQSLVSVKFVFIVQPWHTALILLAAGLKSPRVRLRTE